MYCETDTPYFIIFSRLKDNKIENYNFMLILLKFVSMLLHRDLRSETSDKH